MVKQTPFDLVSPQMPVLIFLLCLLPLYGRL